MPSRSEATAPREFSITADPFVRVAQRLRVAGEDGNPRAFFLVALTWVPLCVAALLRVLAGSPPAAILSDLSVHARLLVVLPLVVAAARMLDARCRDAIAELDEFCEPARLQGIVSRAARLRDSKLAAVAIVGIAVLVGQAALWGLVGAGGVVSGVAEAGEVSVARFWYTTVALPVVQVVLLRWLWHWLIWSYIVVRVSRLELATIATHPDHAAGLGFLGDPISALVVYVAAFSSMLAAAWGQQMLVAHASLLSFVPTFVVFVLVAAVLAVGPLLLYLDVLYRARYRATHAYGPLALEYVRRFRARRIGERAKAGELLGAQDIQSMADLAGAYENLVQVRAVPFEPIELAAVWIAAVIPMVPLVMATMPVVELLRSIGEKMVGGLL